MLEKSASVSVGLAFKLGLSPTKYRVICTSQGQRMTASSAEILASPTNLTGKKKKSCFYSDSNSLLLMKSFLV